MRKNPFPLAIFTSLLIGTAAFGAEAKHMLSLNGGVAQPSKTSSLLGENPSGLIFNDRASLLGFGWSSNDRFSPLGAGGSFQIGNGSIGAGAGIDHINSGTYGFGGLAAEISSLNMALGVGAQFSTSGGLSSSAVNVGVLFSPKGKLRVGLMTYDINNGLDSIGGGLAADISSEATLGVDASTHLKSPSGATIAPGLEIHIQSFQLNAGIGFTMDRGGGGSVPTEFNAGFEADLGKSFHLQAYYNHLARYFFGLSLQL